MAVAPNVRATVEEQLGVHSNIDWVVEQGAPVGPQVYQVLRARIIRAELPPGAQVSETEIARAFSLSRQPVREAFIKLADDGLVEVRPQRGTLVRKINIASVMDARFVREAVEADIAKLVAELHDPDVITDLRAQVEAQRQVVDRAEEFMKLDELFHRSLAVAAGKSQVFKMVTSVKAHMDRVRYLTLMHRSVIVQSIEQHEKIVDAVERGGKEEADSAMRIHLRQILIDLPHVAKMKPEFFDDLPNPPNQTTSGRER